MEADEDGWLDRRRKVLAARWELVRMLRVASPWLVAAAVLVALVAGLLPMG